MKTHNGNQEIEVAEHPETPRASDMRHLRAALRVWEAEHPEAMPVRYRPRKMRKP